ncbi:hypothetical protein DOT_1600 [Desulfosporosinus sp. OT]|nr:hypothetical protein DOT_1600 [Desulfosporosinus sp. OT]
MGILQNNPQSTFSCYSAGIHLKEVFYSCGGSKLRSQLLCLKFQEH